MASELGLNAEIAKRAGMESPFGENPENVEFGTPDELITARIDCGEFTAVKRRALVAHRSQISDDFPMMRMPEEVLREHFPTEHLAAAGPASTCHAGVGHRNLCRSQRLQQIWYPQSAPPWPLRRLTPPSPLRRLTPPWPL